MALSKKMRKKLEQRSKDLEKGSGDFKFIIFKSGITRTRPLPVGEDQEPGVEVIVFYMGKKYGTVISPASWGEPCAIMECYEELKNSKKESNKELASKFMPKPHFVVPSIKYVDEKGTEIDDKMSGKLALTKKGCYQQMVDLMLDEEQGDMTDALKGYDLKTKRTGEGKTGTEYKIYPCKPSKIPKKYRGPYDPEEMAKALTPSYEETETIIKEYLKLDSSDDDDEKSSKKKGKDLKKKKKVKKDM